MPAVKTRFLIVDDEPTVVEIISKFLSQCAGEIRCAYDGEEAVSIAKEFYPDCVVTGIIMPTISGLQEAVAIRQFLPVCKFVFVSGSAHEPSIREEYERLGFDLKFLLEKPFSKNDLLKLLALAGIPCLEGSE